jgi:hypothetical protein
MPEPDAPLHVPMRENDAGAETIGEYLIKLLATVWRQGEDAVHRPFGNSGWQWEVYEALVRGKLADGTITLDEDGNVEVIDTDPRACDELIAEAIAELGRRF